MRAGRSPRLFPTYAHVSLQGEGAGKPPMHSIRLRAAGCRLRPEARSVIRSKTNNESPSIETAPLKCLRPLDGIHPRHPRVRIRDGVEVVAEPNDVIEVEEH